MKVLFVTQRASILEPFVQVFQQQGWQSAIAESGKLAAVQIKKLKYDLVVCHLSHKDPSIGQLLEALRKHQPRVFRVALYPIQDEDLQRQAVANAHHSFADIDEASKLEPVISSFSQSYKGLDKKAIIDAIKQVKTLPSPPKTYMRINAMLKSSASDSHKIAEIIAEDPALAAKVLQVANTSFLASGHELKSITDAITRVGMDTLCCIVMTAELFAYEPKIPKFSLQDEQEKALLVGRFAASLVNPEFRTHAMLAGLLHSIGKLVILEIDAKLTQRFFADESEFEDELAKEQRIFGVNHAQVSAYLLRMWGFPPQVIEAVLMQGEGTQLLRPKLDAAAANYGAIQMINGRDIHQKFINHYQWQDKLESLQQRLAQYRGE